MHFHVFSNGELKTFSWKNGFHCDVYLKVLDSWEIKKTPSIYFVLLLVCPSDFPHNISKHKYQSWAVVWPAIAVSNFIRSGLWIAQYHLIFTIRLSNIMWRINRGVEMFETSYEITDVLLKTTSGFLPSSRERKTSFRRWNFPGEAEDESRYICTYFSPNVGPGSRASWSWPC